MQTHSNSHSVMSNSFVTPCTKVACQAPLCMGFPGKNTGVGCHALLQGIFPPQESNPGPLHCRQILYCLSHQGSLQIHRLLPKDKRRYSVQLHINKLDGFQESNIFSKLTPVRQKSLIKPVMTGEKKSLSKIQPKKSIKPTGYVQYLFIFGCAGSSLLRVDFLQLWRAGAALQLRCSGFLLQRLLYCEAQALGERASAVVAHGLSCSAAGGILPNQGSNQCPLNCKSDSYLLDHLGSLPAPARILQENSIKSKLTDKKGS